MPEGLLRFKDKMLLQTYLTKIASKIMAYESNDINSVELKKKICLNLLNDEKYAEKLDCKGMIYDSK